ncbi:MAG TPA: MBL fold metallo-hydrolase, partial [Ramlibacter sp.]|nr:MBL fold metallo-hydrolase [Ramlibacter sp.]
MSPFHCLVALLMLATAAHAADPQPPKPQVLAAGTWLIPGSFPEDRNPDGNTLVFEGNGGLIVMDTGRHLWHRQAILDFVRARGRPVVAIINSHWHLDHTSGNADLKRLFPQAQLHTSTAVERMITDVWPGSLVRSQALLDSGKVTGGIADDIRGDIATRRNPQALRPDVPVIASGSVTLAGVTLELHLAGNAATEGDVWVYQPATGIAAAGDLITLPVPFLDTACVKGWRSALDELAATPFVTVVPGHGAPMDRAQFTTYKTAFENYTGCAA